MELILIAILAATTVALLVLTHSERALNFVLELFSGRASKQAQQALPGWWPRETIAMADVMSNFTFPAYRTARFKFVPTQNTTPEGLLEKITRPSDSADYRADLISDALAWLETFDIDLPSRGPASERRLAVWEMSRDVIGFILRIYDEDFYADPPFVRHQWAEGASDQDTMNDWIDSFELAREAMDRYVSSRVLQDLTEIAQRTRGEPINPTPTRPFM